jgi:stage IV sporulation protein FB
MASFLGIKTDKIYIYPLGGISKFDMPLNINPKEELLVLITGPLFQVLAYFILILILPKNKELIEIYHYSILIFNLLPIYPLDGGKLLNLFISSFIPYKLSLKLVIFISYLITLILVINLHLNINILVMIIFLLILITKEKLKINYIYNKFILERYLNNYKFKKTKIITNLNNFYRNNNHLIKENATYYTEKEFLEKNFKKFKKNC